MSKLLLSLATPEIREVAEPFLQNHKAWAERNGWDYQCADKKILENRHPSFSKVPLIEKALEDNFDFVIWMDADAAWLRMDADLTKLLKPEHFLAAKEQLNWTAWKYLCAGILVIKNCEKVRAFVDDWRWRCIYGCPDTQPGKLTIIEGMPFEQWHLDALVRKTQYHGIYAARAREIGAFAKEIWTDGDELTDECPTIHLAGPASMEKKAQVFKENYAHLVK